MHEARHITSRRIGALAPLVVLAIGSVMPAQATLWRTLVAGAAVALALYSWRHAAPELPLASLVAALTTLTAFGVNWQLTMALAIGGTTLVARRRQGAQVWSLSRGRVPVAGTVLCGTVTPVALVAWLRLVQPDLSDLTAAIPAYPVGVLLLGGLLFAVANASFEEWIWRGIVQHHLLRWFGVTPALLMQAVSFGCVHAHGFPRGALGVALATTWGVMLGMLRQRSRGLLAVVLAHFVADAAIAAIVLLWAR